MNEMLRIDPYGDPRAILVDIVENRHLLSRINLQRLIVFRQLVLRLIFLFYIKTI